MPRELGGWFLLVLLVIAAVLSLVAWQIVETRELVGENRERIAEGEEAHDGLCAMRVNLETSVASSRKYLTDVTAGRRVPVEGITTADIQASITRQQTTIDALSVLDCQPPPEGATP